LLNFRDPFEHGKNPIKRIKLKYKLKNKTEQEIKTQGSQLTNSISTLVQFSILQISIATCQLERN
jgi:hypothetical protein